MTKKSHPTKSSETNPAQPPAWRTAATVALLLHLLCVGIALVSNAGQESPFRQALRNVPLATDYLQALSMDRAYDFPLAGASPQDGYHRLVLIDGVSETAGVIAGNAGELPGTLPSDSMPLGIRRQRYEHLAFWVSQFNETFAENLDLKTQLPHAVARRWLAERETPSGDYELLCQRIPPKRWKQSPANDPNSQSANTESANTEAANSASAGSRQPSTAQPSTARQETLDLRLLWERDSQDLLVSLREEPSQLAAVVRDESAETVKEEASRAEDSNAEADHRSEQQ